MFESLADLSSKLTVTGYFVDPVMTQVVFLAAKLKKPLLLEGPAGPGKMQLAISVAAAAGIYLAERLVRIEMLRTAHTYELAITSHELLIAPGRTRPEISSALLFRGQDGMLPLDLWKEEHKVVRGELAPTFYSRGGGAINPPQQFETAIRKITGAVCCIGCRHTHVGVPPVYGLEP